MSTRGQLIGSLIGGIGGALFGFGVGGMALGGMIGLWLDPPDPPDPPPLGDLGINSFVRNMPVPIAYGHNKIYGGCIWIGSNGVHTVNEGSNKTPKYSIYYTADFAIAWCEGPVYSFIQPLFNDKDFSELSSEDHVYIELTNYAGTSDQSLDSLISSFSGSEAVPFRYTAYSVASGSIGGSNSLPTLSMILYAKNIEGDGESNTVKALYDFLTDTHYGCCIPTALIDGSPTTSGSWKVAADYCDVSVDGEPRFRYSNYFNGKVKGYDIIKDMLQTCRGFIYYSGGLIKIQIAHNDEIPVFYFSEYHEETFVTSGSCTTIKLYADFSDYPVHSDVTGAAGYWDGDTGIVTYGGNSYTFIVLKQYSTYIDLVDSIGISLGAGVSFTLVKSNIKKDTFSYSRKAKADRYNRHRVEFINKDDKFRTDFVEVDNTYDINLTGEIREQTFQCNGIKRKSQAMRMCTFFSDFNSYVDYTCSFDTDIVGFLLSVGSIIGVTNYVPAWSAKLFRIIALEEMDNYEVKVSCIEYVPSVFSDSADPWESTTTYEIPNPYTPPENSTILELYEDSTENKINICFNKQASYSYWLGNDVYYSYDGVNYYFKEMYGVTSPSVELDSSIDETDDIIPYDAATMFDSFPESGSFWVGNEEIYYGSINDLSDQFEECIRGYNNTEPESHSAGDICSLRKTTTPQFIFTDSDIAKTIYFKAIASNVYGIKAKDTFPENSITIGGKYLKPRKVSSLELNGQGNDHTLVASNDAELTWSVVADGVTYGYGYSYGDYAGYGEGSYGNLIKLVLYVYKTSGMVFLRSYEETDLTLGTYNYTSAYNIADNGSYVANLTFKLWVQNTSYLWSPANILTTND
jgi:hypothetical protein